jgi:hypothetical protein
MKLPARLILDTCNPCHYQQELFSGHFLIALEAAEEDKRAQALTIFQLHGGHRVNFYGKWTVEGLVLAQASLDSPGSP